jgi:hypothetical protein
MVWQLTALGRTRWSELRSGLPGGAVGVWSDIDGFHVGEPPTELLGTTHLWIAAPTASWRLRVDGSSVVGARLEQVASTDSPANAVRVSLEPRQTPDPGLAATLRDAAALTALHVSTTAGDVWFLAVRE